MGQSLLKYLLTLNEAVDRVYTFPLSINTKDCISLNGNWYCCSNCCPVADCSVAKWIFFCLSLFSTKFTALLQKLQTPSNNITGCSFITTKLKQMETLSGCPANDIVECVFQQREFEPEPCCHDPGGQYPPAL